MFSQEEDNRKQLFMAEMGNIKSGSAEKDLIKMLIHFREKVLTYGSLEKTKLRAGTTRSI